MQYWIVQGKVSYDALKQLSKPEMLQNYIAKHRDELIETQIAVAAMDAVFDELELEVPEDELEREVQEAKKQFEVRTVIE